MSELRSHTPPFAYSPVSTLNIHHHDENSLQNLKYHQLLKLSSRYKISKRWAKKDDLIKSLLSLKSQSFNDKENDPANADEWRDGAEVVKEMTPQPHNKKITSRETFIIEKENLNDSRATYNITQTKFPSLEVQKSDSRLTFDIPRNSRNPIKVAPSRQVVKASNKPKLTVPVSMHSVSRNTSKLPSVKESPLKLSNKSISIKKAKDSAVSPMKVARSLMSERKSLSKPRLMHLGQAAQPASMQRPETIKKEPIVPESSARLSMNRRKSKSDDPSASRRPAPATTFFSPPIARNTATKTGGKHKTATKMPDFAAIHQRNFDKMDSLDVYMNKKSDRAKKLFGTPTTYKPPSKATKSPPRPAKVAAVPSVSRIQVLKTPVKAQVEKAKILINKNPHLRTRTDVKDKNRSHIHGVRSNKRFELQMKFRNIS